ncbi:hypothetical protein HNQ07_003605 [Deinococcus metalli]|uniref:Glycosyl hydrolase family 98 putative carbohydrate-binding module domain-containing protein n=1 Tax=Deinococcus metalli TaxID=1141878 RepID=A0A7W8KKA9_9DEIO|nr:NPCBM/NEW2 domain-containing protein [Deinococcus metalli]MBB5378104.1 hypothetical protein [Deinococcus metalli]GHF54472.1 hypothetical protein GCM10017781_33480 [Deinococcus metalli]
MNAPHRPLALLAAPFLLFACSQQPSPAESDPYAGGASYPWSYTRPDDQLTGQSLTAGVNTLYYEPILAATNAWGPIEINRSNGEQGAGDGRTLTIGGAPYAKGYGVHANSEMRFSLKGTNATCTRFTVDAGVDDEVGSLGRVVFQVYLDGVKAYDSGPQTGSDPARRVDLNITGKQELRLVVTDGGDGINYDHADWANPQVYCQATQNQPLTMTVDPSTVSIYHKHTATVKATFSGTFNGPVNLSLPLVSPATGSKLVLKTTQVSLPASGTGTVTRDVVIDAPGLPDSGYDTSLLTANYRLVASQNGQETTSAPLTVTELLLRVVPAFTPSTVSGRFGETRRVTLSLTVSPPLAQPIPIGLFATTQGTDEQFKAVPVGPVYGDGGTMKQDYDITLDPKYLGQPYTRTASYGVNGGDFLGYRTPYYGTITVDLTWNVVP